MQFNYSPNNSALLILINRQNPLLTASIINLKSLRSIYYSRLYETFGSLSSLKLSALLPI